MEVLLEKFVVFLLLKLLKNFYLYNLITFKLYFGLNNASFKTPITLSQKIFYIKNSFLNSSKARLISDKFDVRDYVQSKIGSEYLNTLVGIYYSYNEINIKNFPQKFVLKASHGSNSTRVVMNKNSFNLSEHRRTINRWLRTDYSLIMGETQYYKIKPKIIVEELLENSDSSCLLDYKFWCFNGVIEFLVIREPNDQGFSLSSYDKSFRLTDHVISTTNKQYKKPKSFETMLIVASKLSIDFKFVRVDLYDVDGKCIFGELTLTPTAGLNRYINPKYQNYLGSLIDIS